MPNLWQLRLDIVKKLLKKLTQWITKWILSAITLILITIKMLCLSNNNLSKKDLKIMKSWWASQPRTFSKLDSSHSHRSRKMNTFRNNWLILKLLKTIWMETWKTLNWFKLMLTEEKKLQLISRNNTESNGRILLVHELKCKYVIQFNVD